MNCQEENCDENQEMPPECDLFDKDTIDQIMQAKQERPTQFESYWEADETNIDSWSSVGLKKIFY